MPGLFFIESLDLRGNPDLSSEIVLNLINGRAEISIYGGWVDSSDDFWKILREWAESERQYFPVLYISCHGRRNGLEFGSQFISFKSLSKALGKNCDGCMIFLSACNSLSLESSRHLFSSTGISVLAGYKTNFSIQEIAQQEANMILRFLSKKNLNFRST